MDSEQRTYRVMVVDDNDDVRRLLRKVLEAAGHDVIDATGGREALKLLQDVEPDLILMDVRLPGGMDGMEATASLKEDPRLKRVPVVALTASVTASDRQQAIASGCSGFISKPVDVTAIPELVRQFIARGASAG